MSNTPQREWKYLSRKPGSLYKQLFVTGRRIAARQLFGHFMSEEEPQTHEQIAADYNLPLGAAAVLEDGEGVFHFLARPQLVDHVGQKPLQQLVDQFARRHLALLAQVQELAVQPVAHGPPLVLLDQPRGINAKGQVVAA